MVKPGPRNLITDVPGIKVGQAQDAGVRTGVTLILPDKPAVAACDIRGGGPGTRETDALTADTLVTQADAIVLSGGSVYGLAAADGVAAWLGAQGRGFAMAPRPGVPPSPIVPAAILFDLANGGNKAWGLEPPYRKLGIAAAEAAGVVFALGTAGAGYGAMSGRIKGGIGSASIVDDEGFSVGAIVAVNSFGSTLAPDGKSFWAAPFEIEDEFGRFGTSALQADPGAFWTKAIPVAARENTTIACVATDAALTQAEAKRFAQMACAGFARAIRPVFSPFDGDAVFALATGAREMPAQRNATLARLGAFAADCLARAIARGVHEASPWPDALVETYRNG